MNNGNNSSSNIGIIDEISTINGSINAEGKERKDNENQ